MIKKICTTIILLFNFCFSNNHNNTFSLEENILSHSTQDSYIAGYTSGYLEALSESSVCSIGKINNTIFLSSNSGSSFAIKLAEIVKSINKDSSIHINHVLEKKNSPSIIIWFPNTCLFSPLIADPRQVSKGVTYRFDDDVFGKRVAQVNFSGESSIVRIEKNGKMFQIGIDGGVFALFNMGEPSHGHVADLQNADYFGGINTQFKYKDLEMRFRFYHISCHIGDDFISSLLSFPGERDKQITWSKKLDFIKATSNPYVQATIDELSAQIKNLNTEDVDINQIIYKYIDPMIDDFPKDASTEKDDIKNFALCKTYLFLKHGWVFSNKPSYEILDLAASYQLSMHFRLYACVGLIIRNNPTIDQGKGYLQVGVEAILKARKIMTGLYFRPVYCVHIVYSDVIDVNPSVTYVYGIDLSSSSIFGKRLRIYFESHSGCSQEGMFKRSRASYINLGIKFYF